MFTSLGVQVVVYRNDHAQLVRLAHAIAATTRAARTDAGIERVAVRFGDCHQPATLPGSETALRAALEDVADEVDVVAFDRNLGSAGGSNALAAGRSDDVVWVLNPDTYPSPRCATRMLEALAGDTVVAVDARQIPLVHPKAYDRVTGDVSWASGACLMLRRAAFDAVGGFDDHFFPMYCDDVDLSWRLRHAGGRVVHEPRAVVFHDKRVTADRQLVTSDLERRSGALARLWLTRRYGRPDLEASTRAGIESPDVPATDPRREALAEFDRRVASGDAPEPIAGAADVAQFVEGEYARHRFVHFA